LLASRVCSSMESELYGVDSQMEIYKTEFNLECLREMF